MSRDSHVRWLLDELPSWVEDGIVSSDAATALRHRYAAGDPGSSVSLRSIFLAVLGSLLVGGGVVLLIAHNWSVLDRSARTVVSFAPLLLTQALGFWVLTRRRESTAWRESTGLAIALAVAASIALIGQTYQVPGNLYGFLGVWMLLSLPVVYLFDSIATAVLYLVGTTWWVLVMPSDGIPLLYFAWLAALALFLLRRRSTLLEWLVAVCLIIVWFPVTDELDGELWVPSFALLFGTMALTPMTSRWWYAPIRQLGFIGVVVWSLVLTFSAVWDGWDVPLPARWIVVLTALVLAALVAVTIHRLRTGAERRFVDLVVVIFPALVIICSVLRIGYDEQVAVAIWLALVGYVVVLGLTLMVDGLKRLDAGRANGGLAVLTLLVIVRFFDSDFSLLARGIGFVVVGLGFLGANYLLNRRLKQRRETAT